MATARLPLHALAVALTVSLGLAAASGGCSSGRPPSRVATPESTGSTPTTTTTPGSSAATPPPTGPHDEASLSSKESKTVARTLARVSQLRGVRATRAVPGVKLERDQLVARVKEKALREYPAEAIRREGQLLQMFGFAPPRFDYMSEMMRLLGSQLEGFYEPVNGTMYLAAELRGKEAQATLAHELVHALQDQNWDLKSRSSYRPGKGDETLALACLAEGDATSLMMDYVMADQNRTALDVSEHVLRAMMESGMQSGDAIKSVPHILRSTLIAPYIDGLGFVHALRKRGGWPMVDRAWAKPPTTTEQVLHLEKWEKDEVAVPIPSPSSTALGPGWKVEDEDTFGELGFALTFEEWLDGGDARSAAAGWGGDRSAVFARGDEIAFAVHERYDAATPRPIAFAERAFAKLGPGLKKHLGKPAIDLPDTVCFERKELGAMILARRDRDIVIAAGPARISNAGTWTTTSGCAQSKRWADEILAMF